MSLPHDVIGEIASFVERLKPMILTCKLWHRLITEREDLVDAHANSIMTLYAYIPDKLMPQHNKAII